MGIEARDFISNFDLGLSTRKSEAQDDAHFGEDDVDFQTEILRRWFWVAFPLLQTVPSALPGERLLSPTTRISSTGLGRTVPTV